MTYRAEQDEKLIDRIGKLLAKAAASKFPEERDLFQSRAMQMIADNNLDMAAIEMGGNSAKAAKRTDEKRAGGLYNWQRDLWRAVAELNFCMYFNLYTYNPDKVSKYWARKYGGVANVPEYKRGGYTFQHRLVGRTVNVTLTQTMAEYLEGAIERHLKEALHDRGEHLFSEWANGFRTGAADEVVNKLIQRRHEVLAEEKAKEMQRDAELRAKGAAGHSTDRGITLASVAETEKAGNYDMIHGEGAYAQLLANRARWAEERRIEEERYAKWAKENPEEARRREAALEKEYRRYSRTSWNAGMGKTKYDKGGYNSGSSAGRKISIDPQMKSGTAGMLK